MISVTILGDDPCLKKEVFLSAVDVPSSVDQAEKKIHLPSSIDNNMQEYSVCICNTTTSHERRDFHQSMIGTSNAIILVMNGASMKPPFVSFRYYMKIIRENQSIPLMGEECNVPVVLMVMNLVNPKEYEHAKELNTLCIDFELIAKAMVAQGQLDEIKIRKAFDAAYEYGRTHLTITMMSNMMNVPSKSAVRCKSIHGTSQVIGKHVSQPDLTSSDDFREMQAQLNIARVPSPEIIQRTTCESPSSDRCSSPGDVRSTQPTPSPSPRNSEKSYSPRKIFSAKRAQKSMSAENVTSDDDGGCALQ